MKASKALVRRIRQDLMSKTSDAEKAAIRNCERLGYKVVRQQPILTGRKMYFADIYIPLLKLIIEVNGGYHFTDNQKRKDKNRSQGVRRLGYSLFNIKNKDARDIKKIEQLINKAKNETNNRTRDCVVWRSSYHKRPQEIEDEELLSSGKPEEPDYFEYMEDKEDSHDKEMPLRYEFEQKDNTEGNKI